MSTLDGFTPTEYLVMDVLAARWRLGEDCWTFPSALSKTLGRLSRKDYISFKSGVVQGTEIAWLESRGTQYLRLDKPFVLSSGEQAGRVWCVEIRDEDLRIDIYNPSNWEMTARRGVRIQHLPSGLVAFSDTEDSQLQNKAKCLEQLHAALVASQNKGET